MVRRLIASLTVWTCLFGMIQPALACAPGGDYCCPKGSPAGRIDQATVPAAIAVDDSCCAPQAIKSSPCVAAQPRKADQGASPPASMGAPVDLLVAQLPTRAALLLRTDYRRNESLTYLRTARLRL